MVAIVVGQGLGLDLSSLMALGARGQLGDPAFGRYGENVSVNAANGNLILGRVDEILTGQGPSDTVVRTYNSLANSAGYGANNGWQTNDARCVWGLSGTVNTAGSTVYRTDADGSVETYAFNASRNAYVCTQEGLAANRLTFSSSNNSWTFVNGKTQTSEVYDASNGGRIVSATDANGNALTYSYTGNLLTQITTADGEYTQLVYSGNNLVEETTHLSGGATLSRVCYSYDTSNRLSTVTTDLSPTDNSTSDGNTVVTTYGYDGTSNRITSISQTGGAQLAIAYQLVNGNYCVASLTQTTAAGVTSTTGFSYDTVNRVTTITDNVGNQTTLSYDANGQLSQLQLPPAQSGAAAETLSYTYDTGGNVLTATDGSGNVTTYTYDSNDNLLSRKDPLGNYLTYTYDANNHVLTATQSGSPVVELGAVNESLVVCNVGDTATLDPRADSTDITGGTVTITSLGSPSHGTASIINSGTAVLYTRTSAGADTFSYTLTDTQGYTATASVTVADSTTQNPNPPTASAVSATISGVGTLFTFDPRASCSDPNNYALSIASVSAPAHGTATVNAGGTAITYTRTSSGTDTFNYTVSNGHGGTATASVTFSETAPASGGPTAGAAAITVPGTGSSFTFDPRAYDSDPNNYPLTITAVSSPAHGTATINGNGTSITYARSTSGADSFTYTISNGHGQNATATISVADASPPQNVPPVAANVTAYCTKGTTVTFDPRANCSDVNNYALTITSVTAPSKGTASIVNSGTAISYTAPGSGAVGTSFQYTISDGNGHTATATVTIAAGSSNSQVMTAVNDAVANPAVNGTVTISPLANDANFLARSLTVTILTQPSNGTAHVINGGTQIQYTRTGSASGDSFTYSIWDGLPFHVATATVTVGFIGAAQQVTANTLSQVLYPVGSTVTLTPLNGDYNFLSYGMTITAVGTPSFGTATIINNGTAIQYTRTAYGDDSFYYVISDGHGHQVVSGIYVNGIGVAQTLTTTNDAVVVNAVGDATTINPLANDANLFAFGMTITAVSAPAHGTATIVNGGTGITYTRTGAGNDSFTYTVSDGHGTTKTATVTVNGSVNPPPSTVGPADTSRFAYDSLGNVRFLVDGDGQVTEYRYNGFGQRVAELTYTDNVYNVSGLAPTASISLSALQSWVSSIAGLSTIKRVDTTYDFRGNVATVTTYTSCDATTGAGLTSQPFTVITYSYDPSGRVLSRQTSGASNSEVFHYDGLWRTTYAVDLNGGATNIQYNDAQNTSQVTLANGLVTTSTYDLAGRLISATQSSTNVTTATAAYRFDSLGNLGLATDATGNNSYFLFDTLGRKVAAIAADGSMVEYRYDQSNRLIATIAYATRLNTAQLTSLLDGSGNPTDPAVSSIRPASSSSDEWSYRVYDADNRPVETIDAAGGVTVFAYDAFSNLISTTSYSNTLSAAALQGFQTSPPASLQLPTANPAADTTTRRFYDNEGRLTGQLDADGYLSQIIYDNAGEKIQETQYTTAASASLWTTGTFAQLLASVGTTANDITTRHFYDDRGLLRYTLDANLRPCEYVYDNAGNLLTRIEYAGPIASTSNYTLAYVQSQIVSSGLSTNANNRKTWSVYDTATGNLDYTIDAMGEVVQFRYDAVGHVIKETRFATLDSVSSSPSQATMDSWASANATASDRVTRSLYNPAGELVYAIDGESYVTEYRYDAAGRLTLQIRYADPYAVNDSVTQSSLAAQLPSTIPSTAVQTSFSYDADGRTTDTFDGLGNDTHLVYDALGRVTDRTVAYGTADAATTHYTYDSANRVLSETRAYGQPEAATTSYVYDGMGRVLSETDADSNTTTFTYDALGHVLTRKDALNNVTTNTYDAFGNVQTTADALGNKSYFFYDLLDRLTLSIDRMGFATATSYTIGNEIASATRYATAVTGTITPGTPPSITTSASDATTSFTRDLMGRVTKLTDAEGYFEQYALNAFGDRITVTNKLGGVTSNSFDHRGLLISEILPRSSVRSDGTTEAASVTNTYSYDARGNRITMVEASGLSEQRTTTYAYDKLDRLTQTSGDAVQVVASDLNTVSTVTPATIVKYDNRGNVIETDDALGNRSLAYYDHLNRRIATVNAAGTLSTWTYDGNGNAIASTVYGDAVTLPSNPGGAPPAPVNANNCRQITYTYDKDNRLLTTTFANLTTGDYTNSYSTGTGNVTTTNQYDALGNLIKQTDGRGKSIFTYYDKEGRKTAQVDQEKYLTSWLLDSNGNVLTETRYTTQADDVSTSHPPNIASSADDRITAFTYDRNGNRLTEQRQNVAAYTINATNGALTAATGTATVTYSYNGLGEVTRKTYATGDYTAYSYDSAGRQTQVALSSFTDWTGTTVQTTTAESYDGLNNLTRASVYDALNGGTPAHITAYTYGAGGRLAIMTDAAGFVRAYGYDANGRTMKVSYTRLLSDGVTQATEAQAYQYDAAGRQTLQAVASWNGTNWVFGDQYQTLYDAYGEVAAQGINGLSQLTYAYDSAGRLWKTNANDGVTKLYVYDKAGNQSLEITSAGGTLPTGYSWATLTVAQALALLTNNGAHAVGGVDTTAQGLMVTITTHDGRGQALQTIQPFRGLSASTTASLTDTKAYNAFGELAQETDANGNVTNYTYSTLGNALTQLLPTVNDTIENGAVQSARPTTTYYYDIAGRVIGVQDANGNLSTRTLLANTGHDGAKASVLKEFHPDSGIYSNLYDVFGNLKQAINGVGAIETYTYDPMGRLTAVAHATRPAGSIGNNTGSPVTLTDSYAYDGLGQRTQHWNSQQGSAVKEATDYDLQGRIVKQVDFDGYATTFSYAWSASAATSGLGTFGGWNKTTVNSAGLTETETDDLFGRTVAKVDFGGNGTSNGYGFDLAGRLTSMGWWSQGANYAYGDQLVYGYYNTGRMATASHRTGSYSAISTNDQSFSYDANGNRTAETLVYTTGAPDANGNDVVSNSSSYENATATYDALNRITSESDTGYNATDASSMTWEYDLNSNVRHRNATYYTLNNNGTASTTQSTQDNWYRYDNMNRVVTTEGEFTGARGSGAIDRGPNGTDITYDAAGNRATSAVTLETSVWGIYSFQEEKETYTYTADGYLAQTSVADGSSSSSAPPPQATGPGTLQASYIRDAMGRVTSYSEYDSSGSNVVYSKLASYDAKGQVLSDQVTTLRSDGNTWVWSDTFDYKLGVLSGGNITYTGAYQGGAITHDRTTVTKNFNSQPTTDTQNLYTWRDTALQSQTSYSPNINNSTLWTTTYSYDSLGHLTQTSIQDGSPRTIGYVANLDGQLLASSNSKGPQTRNYFLDNIEEGTVTNDGANSNLSYSQSIASHQDVPGSGFFQNGNGADNYANFDGSYDAINGLNYQQAGASYSVQAGDTLQSIAQAVWGDSSFWYLIADANGLSSASSLQVGQTLVIPNKVANVANNSSTQAVYDPSQTIGDTSPTHPPKPQHHGCGIFGMILLAVIAIAVAVVTYGALIGAEGGLLAGGALFGSATASTIAAGAIAGVAGSIVSQGIGLATGIQNKFSWSSVAEAAIGGAVGAEVAPLTEGLTGSSFADGFIAGAASSAIAQGVEVATGLQNKFDWVGVAAAAVGGGVTNAVIKNADILPGSISSSVDTTRFVAGMAGAIANAATRSLIKGTDFGSNLLVALPDVIGQTIGNAIAGAIDQPSSTTSSADWLSGKQYADAGQSASDASASVNDRQIVPNADGSITLPDGTVLYPASPGDVPDGFRSFKLREVPGGYQAGDGSAGTDVDSNGNTVGQANETVSFFTTSGDEFAARQFVQGGQVAHVVYDVTQGAFAGGALAIDDGTSYSVGLSDGHSELIYSLGSNSQASPQGWYLGFSGMRSPIVDALGSQSSGYRAAIGAQLPPGASVGGAAEAFKVLDFAIAGQEAFTGTVVGVFGNTADAGAALEGVGRVFRGFGGVAVGGEQALEAASEIGAGKPVVPTIRGAAINTGLILGGTLLADAAAGAALGSVFPGAGTVAGAAAGVAIGLLLPSPSVMGQSTTLERAEQLNRDSGLDWSPYP